ncbi:NAD(P)-binding protein [Xylariomycetidae sp. FL2044]|nr:NAD(P)-binding protein [Xylariomycetidae sp. FL2044]
MHILIIGGSGRTGQLAVKEALAQGHSVTVLTRSQASFPVGPHANLTVIEGTPLRRADVASAFIAMTTTTSPTAVIVALNARRQSDSPFAAPSEDTPDRLMADSVANVVAEMRERDMRRIVVMSSWGAGNSFSSMNFLFRAMFTHTNMRLGLQDHNAVDAETRVADVDFTLVRPVLLADGEAREVKVFPDDGAGIGFMPKITRASVAKWMVDACGSDEFSRRSPVISN